VPDEPHETLQPAVVPRVRGRWRPAVRRLHIWSSRRSRLRRGLVLACVGRRDAKVPPLRLVLARRPVHVLHVSRSAHGDARSWSSSTTVLQTLRQEQAAAVSQQILTVAHAEAAPVPGISPLRAPPAPAMLLQPHVRRVTRERSRFERIERLEPAASIAGPSGPAGPPGLAGPPGRVATVLVRPSASAAASPGAAEPARSAAAALEVVRELRPRAQEQPAPAPDVDELTTQVLRRIERRAIAQRERLGGVV
jgi:hypothetical protein